MKTSLSVVSLTRCAQACAGQGQRTCFLPLGIRTQSFRRRQPNMLRQFVTRRSILPLDSFLCARSSFARASHPRLLSTNTNTTIDTMADAPSSSKGPSNRPFRKRPSSRSHPRPTPAKRPANASPATSAPFSTTATASFLPRHSAKSDDADEKPFTELADLHPDLLKSVTQAKGLHSMTSVQAQTLPLTLRGVDVLAQAKTGTGKTLAFLLPAIQRLIQTRPISKSFTPGPATAPRQPSLLVLSPTRELATQIATEAKELLQGLQRDPRNPSQFKVVTVMGGTPAKSGVNKVKAGCDLLIATPGRLIDYMGDEDVIQILSGVQTLVLDEADRLLDMGFIRDIKKILGRLPDRTVQQRQSMLFSATIGANVHEVASLILSKDRQLVNTVPEGEPQTHERVSQRLITVDSFADLAPASLGAIAADMKTHGSETFKAILFLPTAAHVDLYAAFLQALAAEYKLPQVLPIHGRLSQGKRTSTTNTFRSGKNGIMVATDVIARGLDFPNVTHVYQAGLPSEKAQYIHRLGRTARAGADGSGTLLLTRKESGFAKKDLNQVDFRDAPPVLTAESSQVGDAMRAVEERLREKVYASSLGFYKGSLKTLGSTPAQLVQEMNNFSRDGLFLAEPPAIQKMIVGKMGFKGVPGLRIAPNLPREPRE